MTAGVVVETPDVRVTDVRELDWEPRGDGNGRKWLGGDDGEAVAEVVAVPPGGRIAAGPGEELWYTLAGELRVGDRDRMAQDAAAHLRGGGHGKAGPAGWQGLVVQTGVDSLARGVDVVDGRALDWQGGEYGNSPLVHRKVLFRYADGDPKLQLLFFPPGLAEERDEFPRYVPVKEAHRHHHHVMLELVYVLDGEFPFSEWEAEERREGVRVWWREGHFHYRRPDSLHGVEPGATSLTGVTIVHYRLGGSEEGTAFPEPTVVEVPIP